MPQIFAARTASPLFLPSLSRLNDDPESYARQFTLAFRIISVGGSIVAVGFLLSGTTVTTLVYSDQFAGVASFIGWLGVASGIRILRMAPVIAAFSKADTKIPLFANIGRSIAIIGFLFVVLEGLPLVWISRCLVISECLALATAMIALRMRHHDSLRNGLPGILFMAIWIVLAAQLASLGILHGTMRTLGATLLIELVMIASAVATILPVGALKEIARSRGHDGSEAASRSHQEG
jgi:hypothetical protein